MPTNLKFLIGLKPKLAIAFLKKQGVKLPADWKALHKAAEEQAGDIADRLKLDILQKTSDAVADAVERGLTFQQFKKELKENFEKWGFWGKKKDRVPGTEKFFSPHRVELVYRNNVSSAMQAGRWKRQWENRDNRPYGVYHSAMTDNTRDHHAAMHLRAFPIDDPVWDNIYPKNGHNCKCWVTTHNAKQLESMRIEVQTPVTHVGERQWKKGEKPEKYGFLMIKNRAGKDIEFSADPGWSHNPGKKAFKLKTDSYDKELVDVYEKSRK